MAGIAALVYGLVCYVVFLVSFLYAIGFVGNLWVPKSIDTGAAGSPWGAMIVNLVLLGLFAAQHNIMARPAFKRWWTRIVPTSVERSTFVLFASLLLILMYWKWQPITQVVWHFEGRVAQLILLALFWIGWLIVLLSTFLINHFDLFGLRQVFLRLTGQSYKPLEFKTAAFYKYVRHPLLLGFVIAFWATPTMTLGHLLFAGVTTTWMLISIRLEERDLQTFHGELYRRYQQEVPMLIPWRRARKTKAVE